MAGMTTAELKASAPSRKSMDVSVVRLNDDSKSAIFRFQVIEADGTRGQPWLETVKILDQVELEHDIDGKTVQETHVFVEMKAKNKVTGALETVQKWMAV